MKPLFIFETPKKQKASDTVLIDRVNEALIPKLKRLGFKCEFHNIDEIGAGLLLRITNKEGKQGLIIPWIRPVSTNKTIVKTLADYPRLNIHKDVKIKSEQEKVNSMFAIYNKYNVYFIVMLQKNDNNDLFWIDAYTAIPKEFWKPTYREKEKGTDRIHFPHFQKYHFTKEQQLKTKLNTILS